MANLRVASYQMRVCGDLDANFAKIKYGIERAAAAGAGLIALPECAVSGYPPLVYSGPEEIDYTRIAELNGEIAQLAADNNIWVVVGTIVMSSEGPLNSALVIANDGGIAGRYDKLHLMPDDKKFFAPGCGAWTFDLDSETRIGVLICYDMRFPEPFRYLREQGAQVIVLILNACGGDTWKVPVVEGVLRTRASENSCYLVAANAAGPLQMGTSRICNPLGLDLASANQDREEMLISDLDLSACESGYFFDRRLDQFKVWADFEPIISEI